MFIPYLSECFIVPYLVMFIPYYAPDKFLCNINCYLLNIIIGSYSIVLALLLASRSLEWSFLLLSG